MTVATKHVISVVKADEGDLRVSFDPTNEDDVNLARKTFAEAKDKGYFAYKVEDGENEELKEFDPAASVIVMTPVLAGG